MDQIRTKLGRTHRIDWAGPLGSPRVGREKEEKKHDADKGGRPVRPTETVRPAFFLLDARLTAVCRETSGDGGVA
jgi:hypothetical protein